MKTTDFLNNIQRTSYANKRKFFYLLLRIFLLLFTILGYLVLNVFKVKALLSYKFNRASFDYKTI